MLHSYTFSNVHSFLERTEVSLRLNAKASSRGWERVAPSGQRLNLAAAVLGPNAAGKTGLLNPLGFLSWFMRHSFTGLKPEQRLPFEPHFTAKEQPSDFELEAEDGSGVVWRYVLRTTVGRVLHEALYRKKERFSYVFVRDWDDNSKSYVIKQQDFGLASAEAQKVRPNASLISTAAQYGVENARHVSGFRLFTNLHFLGRKGTNDESLLDAAEFFNSNESHRTDMARLLTSWDLGLQGVELQEITVPPSSGQSDATKFWFPLGVHKSKDGGVHQLPFLHESRGTQAAFVLLSDLLPALAVGGIALIDEFENDLHPLMLKPILELFDSNTTNPYGAQILFTCHSPEVLHMLQKAQVFLVQKSACESSAWRLDSVQGVRSDDNLAAKYLSGAFDAVPRFF